MLLLIKRSLLGVLCLGLSVSTQAEELWIWQVPDIKGKPPIFYQTASKSSKAVSTFKPNQTVQVLSKQKDWAEIRALNNSGQIAWIPMDEVKAITTVDIALNQTPNAYQCQVFVRDPEGRETGNWRIAYRVFESSGSKEQNKKNQSFKGWSFGKKDPAPKDQEDFEKALLQLEESFAKQRAAMIKMMGRLFPIMMEESAEIAKHISEAKLVAAEATDEDKPKPQETQGEVKEKNSDR